MSDMSVSFEQAGIPAGVIVHGVDFADIGDDVFAQLHKAFLTHHVLCIRGSEISQQQHLDFAARWGKVHQHPYVPSIEGFPGMMKQHLSYRNVVPRGSGIGPETKGFLRGGNGFGGNLGVMQGLA